MQFHIVNDSIEQISSVKSLVETVEEQDVNRFGRAAAYDFPHPL